MSERPPSFEERYNLRRPLWLDGSHGGWLARDRVLGREVVVNRPYRPEDVAWFRRMTAVRAKLRHANIVPLYDAGETADGTPFFTEPVIEATDLWRVRHEGDDVTLPRLVGYLLDAAKAVAYLHANGYLHLELRPGSVLVAPAFQEVFLVHDGPATCPVRVPKDAQDFVMGGVTAYLAPEQADPVRRGEPDALTDVYGLGGILFDVLHDHPPGGDRSTPIVDLFMALATRQGPPPRRPLGRVAARSPALARKLEAVCQRALESDRGNRQPSVAAFAAAVEECVWA